MLVGILDLLLIIMVIRKKINQSLGSPFFFYLINDSTKIIMKNTFYFI